MERHKPTALAKHVPLEPTDTRFLWNYRHTWCTDAKQQRAWVLVRSSNGRYYRFETPTMMTWYTPWYTRPATAIRGLMRFIAALDKRKDKC